MSGENWPDYARVINYREPWELRYWSRKLLIPVEKLMQVAENALGDLKVIRAELAKRN